jgi:hypothetical protein
LISLVFETGDARGVTVRLSGSTRSVYTLTLDGDGFVRCDCPDFKGQAKRYRCLCEHPCFLIVKVGKIHADNRMFVERPFRGESLAAVASKWRILAIGFASVDPDLVDHDLSSQYAAVVAGEKRMGDGFTSVVADDETAELEDCPICYDSLARGDRQRCPDCNKDIHGICITRWLRVERNLPPLSVAGLEASWEQCSFEQTVLATLIDRERTVEVPKSQERIYEETLRAFLELYFGQFSFTGQYFGRKCNNYGLRTSNSPVQIWGCNASHK